ncbi:serine/arginine repetitive matrix protein 3-like [Kogia breviceps]|uniref:serine/arginine repetitive matrix protein 3-like n=1 Tax=Kogia breviceps TaxID=27615 RepID=UPI002795338B|nr:serine/arginine repetitive matrix protein 3-like [Kogia breviceps]
MEKWCSFKQFTLEALGICLSGDGSGGVPIRAAATPGSNSGSDGREQEPGLEAASGRQGSGGKEPARTRHPGALQGTLFSSPPHPNLHHRSPRHTLRGRISSVTRSGSPRKWRGHRGRRPPSPSLRPRGQGKKSPEKAPRPRQTCSLPSCCPQPHTSGGQGGAQSHTGSRRRREGRSRAPTLSDAAGRPPGFRSSRQIQPNAPTQGRSATRPPDSPGPPTEPRARASPRAARAPTRSHRPAASAVLERGSGSGRGAAGRPAGGTEGRGGGAALRPATRRGDSQYPAAAELCAAPWKWGAEESHRPGEGARRGGWATEDAPIGPGSRPSARATSPSRGAPPRLVRRRPEGSGAFPAAWVYCRLSSAASRRSRHTSKSPGPPPPTEESEATFAHADSRHPQARASGAARGKRAGMRVRVASGRTAGW